MFTNPKIDQTTFGPAFENIQHPQLIKFIYLFIVFSIMYLVIRLICNIILYYKSKPLNHCLNRYSSLPNLVLLSGLFATLYLFYGMFNIVKRHGADSNAIFGTSAESLVPFMVGTVCSGFCYIVDMFNRIVDSARLKLKKTDHTPVPPNRALNSDAAAAS